MNSDSIPRIKVDIKDILHISIREGLNDNPVCDTIRGKPDIEQWLINAFFEVIFESNYIHLFLDFYTSESSYDRAGFPIGYERQLHNALEFFFDDTNEGPYLNTLPSVNLLKSYFEPNEIVEYIGVVTVLVCKRVMVLVKDRLEKLNINGRVQCTEVKFNNIKDMYDVSLLLECTDFEDCGLERDDFVNIARGLV